MSVLRSRVALVLLLALLVFIYGKWVRIVANDHRTIDFAVYYIAAEAIARGENPYTVSDPHWDELALEKGLLPGRYTRPYYYPPLTALTVRLFSSLPPVSAATVWAAASALAAALSAFLLARTSNKPESLFLAFGIVGGFYPVLDSISYGQVNVFLLLSLCAAYHALHRKWPVWAGTWLALGVHLKIVPIVNLGAFFVARRWKVVASALASGILLLVPGILVLGVRGGLGFLSLEAKAGGDLKAVWDNQALSGFLARALEGHPVLILLSWLASAAAVLAITGALYWKRGNIRAPGAGGISVHSNWESESRLFALATISSNLAMPYTYYHQLCLLAIPLFVLVGDAVRSPDRRWRLLPLTLGYALTAYSRLFWGDMQAAGFPVSLPLFFCLFCWFLLIKDLRGGLRTTSPSVHRLRRSEA